MEIAIDNRFRLVTTRTGWEIQQYRPASKGKNAGKPGWRTEGHCDTLQWALRAAAQLMVHEGSGKATLEQLAQRMEVVEERLAAALAGYMTPTMQQPYQSSYRRPVAPLGQLPTGPWAEDEQQRRVSARRGR